MSFFFFLLLFFTSPAVLQLVIDEAEDVLMMQRPGFVSDVTMKRGSDLQIFATKKLTFFHI